MLHQDLTERILESFYRVYNTLDYGFLEKVYENALSYDLRQQGLHIVQQQAIEVHYHDIKVGQYFADILVNNKVIIELKASESLREEHEYQLINYLKATDIEIGLLLNFGKKPTFKRKIFSNNPR